MTHSAWISLLVRLMLGSIFLALGIDKLSHYTETVERIAGQFAETWLPAFMVTPVAYLIPIWELTLGLLFLTGFMYRQTLIACGLLIVALTFGKAVQGAPDVVARNFGFMITVLIGLMHEAGNRFALNRRRT